MIIEHGVIERQSCKSVELPSSTDWYKQKEKDDSECITILGELVDKHPMLVNATIKMNFNSVGIPNGNNTLGVFPSCQNSLGR